MEDGGGMRFDAQDGQEMYPWACVGKLVTYGVLVSLLLLSSVAVYRCARVPDGYYRITIKCDNCGRNGQEFPMLGHELPIGVAIEDAECPQCGLALSRRRVQAP